MSMAGHFIKIIVARVARGLSSARAGHLITGHFGSLCFDASAGHFIRGSSEKDFAEKALRVVGVISDAFLQNSINALSRSVSKLPETVFWKRGRPRFPKVGTSTFSKKRGRPRFCKSGDVEKRGGPRFLKRGRPRFPQSGDGHVSKKRDCRRFENDGGRIIRVRKNRGQNANIFEQRSECRWRGARFRFPVFVYNGYKLQARFLKSGGAHLF